MNDIATGETVPLPEGAAPERGPVEETAVLACRVARLERARRRSLVVVAGLGLLLASGAVRWYQAVEPGRYELRDARGTVRAAWSVGTDRTAALRFFDEDGHVRLALEMARDGSPQLNLLNAGGTLSAALAVRPDGTPGIALADREGKVRLSLDLGPDGSSGINLYNASGTLRAALAIRPDGSPGLGLFDEQGAIRRSIDLDPEAKTAPGLAGPDGPVASVPRPHVPTARLGPPAPAPWADGVARSRRARTHDLAGRQGTPWKTP